MEFAWDFLIILKSASRSGQKASKTIGYSDGCANVRIHGAKQGTAGGWLGAIVGNAEKTRSLPREEGRGQEEGEDREEVDHQGQEVDHQAGKHG